MKYQKNIEENSRERNIVLEIRQYSYNAETEKKTFIRRKDISLKISLVFFEYWLDHYCFMPSIEEAQMDSDYEEAAETCWEVVLMPSSFGYDAITIHHIVEDYSTEELERAINNMIEDYESWGTDYVNWDHN